MLNEQLVNKWQPVLEHEDMPEIKESYRKVVTAHMLEQQETAMREEAQNVGSASLLGESTTPDTVAGNASIIGGGPRGRNKLSTANNAAALIGSQKWPFLTCRLWLRWRVIVADTVEVVNNIGMPRISRRCSSRRRPFCLREWEVSVLGLFRFFFLCFFFFLVFEEGTDSLVVLCLWLPDCK